MPKRNTRKTVLTGTRKVIRAGKGSLAITIPIYFCHIHGIKAGMSLPFAAGHNLTYFPLLEEEPGEEKAAEGVPRTLVLAGK